VSLCLSLELFQLTHLHFFLLFLTSLIQNSTLLLSFIAYLCFYCFYVCHLSHFNKDYLLTYLLNLLLPVGLTPRLTLV